LNHLITYDEAAGFLTNPPLLEPCPDFTKIWALRKHITNALKLLERPLSILHRLTGLAMDPTMYALLDPTPFVAPPDPGEIPIYLPFVTPAAINTIDCLYKNTNNNFMSYVNVSCALFRMLDKNIDDSFKVSNNPTLTG
jgi:hypothetical protein